MGRARRREGEIERECAGEVGVESAVEVGVGRGGGERGVGLWFEKIHHRLSAPFPRQGLHTARGRACT